MSRNKLDLRETGAFRREWDSISIRGLRRYYFRSEEVWQDGAGGTGKLGKLGLALGFF